MLKKKKNANILYRLRKKKQKTSTSLATLATQYRQLTFNRTFSPHDRNTTSQSHCNFNYGETPLVLYDHVRALWTLVIDKHFRRKKFRKYSVM